MALTDNKRAVMSYELLEKFEAGLVLLGHEVKSIKAGSASLKESYVGFIGEELFLIKCHVPLYKGAAGLKDSYNTLRNRKLLLKKRELMSIKGKISQQGLTLVPLKIYTNKSLLKLEFAIGRGLKKYDKRELIKKRETDRYLKVLTKKKARG